MNVRRPIWLKLLFVTVPFFVPIVLLGYSYLSTSWDTIATTTQEKKGVEYVVAARHLIEHFARHRGLVSGYLNGDSSLKSRIDQEENAVEVAVRGMDAASDRYGAEFKVEAAWATIKADWLKLKEKAIRSKPAAAFTEHTQLIKKVFALYMDAAEASFLPLDPDVESYYLQDTAITRLFYVIENLGPLRGLGTGYLAQKTVGLPEKAILDGYDRNLGIVREMINRDMESALRARPALHRDLDSANLLFNNSLENFSEFLKERILDPEKTAVTPKEFFDVATRPLDASYAFFDAIIPQLGKLLDERIAKTRVKIQVTLAVVVVSLLVSMLLAWFVSKGILLQIKALNDTFAEVGVGNFAARAAVLTRDELGTAAVSLNGMLGSLMTLLEQPEETPPANTEPPPRVDDVQSAHFQVHPAPLGIPLRPGKTSGTDDMEPSTWR